MCAHVTCHTGTSNLVSCFFCQHRPALCTGCSAQDVASGFPSFLNSRLSGGASLGSSNACGMQGYVWGPSRVRGIYREGERETPLHEEPFVVPDRSSSHQPWQQVGGSFAWRAS